MSFEISPRMYLGIDEPWISKLSKKYLKTGDIVYDIGAHIGYTALVFSKSVGSTGFVHAFEILPTTVKKFLEKTVQVNKLDNIIIHNVGLSNHDQKLTLAIGETFMTSLNAISHGINTDLCRVVPLDQFFE